uniref:FTH domain-containing protein n=2 Tax=Caenorhabditis tropicalis TaxID=1561998 RepID=A0A1I7UNI4_9PELO
MRIDAELSEDPSHDDEKIHFHFLVSDSMILLTFLFYLSTHVVADNVIHIQYFRRPEEYGIFRVDLDGSKKWESYIYMNKSANIREDDIYKLIKPFFEGEPSTRKYESSSITRHLGKQFEYILNRYPINEIIFENLCSQMKPKFSSLLTSSSQLPRKIKWIIEHPSASFLIPYGFTKGVGREEYHLEVKGKASLHVDNFDYEALQNAQKLIVKQDTEFPNGVSGEKLLKIKGSEVLIEGRNEVDSDDIKMFAEEWNSGDRFIQKWEIHVIDDQQQDQFYFEKNGFTLDASVSNGKFIMTTYKTPENRSYQFTSL